jgi:hypothetical protein
MTFFIEASEQIKRELIFLGAVGQSYCLGELPRLEGFVAVFVGGVCG